MPPREPPVNAPLCGPCAAEWERVLAPGGQPPEMFRLIHIGNPTGADLNRAALARADEHWRRVRAYQDHVAAACRSGHAQPPRAAATVIDLPLPDPDEEVADATA